MGKNKKDVEDVCEDIFSHQVGDDKLNSFLKYEEIAWKNSFFPNTLEKKDLPHEVLRKVEEKKIEQFYSEEIFAEKDDGMNHYNRSNFKKI